MPDALLDVAGDSRLERDLDALGRALVDAERVRERILARSIGSKRSSVTDSD